jgi:hypothetical protein
LLGSRTILACSRHWPHGEPVREAGHDLAIDETAEVAFAHADPAADVASEHELGHLGRSLTAEAIHQLRVGAVGERQDERRGRGDPNGHCALTWD